MIEIYYAGLPSNKSTSADVTLTLQVILSITMGTYTLQFISDKTTKLSEIL